MIMYVTAKQGSSCPTGDSGGTVAYAGGCSYDQYDRPTVGYVNFCPTMIDMAASQWESQWSTGVHEIMHAMGFSSSRFAWFWDHSPGQPRTSRGAIKDTS